MTRLEDLLHSLTTVLIRYHDSQGSKKLIVESDKNVLRTKSRAYAINLLQNPEGKISINDRLNTIIKNCTNGYTLRTPFLSYILHEINFLRSIVNRNTPLSEAECETQQQQLIQLFFNFKQLLITTKNTSYNVKYSKFGADKDPNQEVTITLSGLKNDAYVGTELCNSGILLTEEVFDRLHINVKQSDDELKAAVNRLCKEHHYDLLVPQLIKQNGTLKEQNHEQSALIVALTTQLDEAKSKIMKQTVELNDSQTQVGSLKGENDVLKKRVSELSEAPIAPVLPPDFLAGLGGGLGIFNNYGRNSFPVRVPKAPTSTVTASGTPQSNTPP